MRILAIETVGTTGSVAALDDERVLAEHPLDPRRRSGQTLAPGIATLLEHVGWRAGDVELVAVASGPGSFTGLRIGVATAKAFAYASGCPIVGVHTLSAIAARVPHDVPQFAVVLDAGRGELFVADFRRLSAERLVGSETTCIVGRTQWLAGLASGQVVTGPGLSKLLGQLPPGARVVDEALWAPTAASVGRIGHALFLAGERTSVFDLVPQYFRRTAAEEQWEAKGK